MPAEEVRLCVEVNIFSSWGSSGGTDGSGTAGAGQTSSRAVVELYGQEVPAKVDGVSDVLSGAPSTNTLLPQNMVGVIQPPTRLHRCNFVSTATLGVGPLGTIVMQPPPDTLIIELKRVHRTVGCVVARKEYDAATPATADLPKMTTCELQHPKTTPSATVIERVREVVQEARPMLVTQVSPVLVTLDPETYSVAFFVVIEEDVSLAAKDAKPAVATEDTPMVVTLHVDMYTVKFVAMMDEANLDNARPMVETESVPVELRLDPEENKVTFVVVMPELVAERQLQAKPTTATEVIPSALTVLPATYTVTPLAVMDVDELAVDAKPTLATGEAPLEAMRHLSAMIMVRFTIINEGSSGVPL